MLEKALDKLNIRLSELIEHFSDKVALLNQRVQVVCTDVRFAKLNTWDIYDLYEVAQRVHDIFFSQSWKCMKIFFFAWEATGYIF